MSKIDKVDFNEILERSHRSSEVTVYCPKVTYKVDFGAGLEEHSYYDITDAFNDFEEGKIMGRRWIFEKGDKK